MILEIGKLLWYVVTFCQTLSSVYRGFLWVCCQLVLKKSKILQTNIYSFKPHIITDPFRGFRASQNLRAHGCSRHFCTFTSYRISQVFTKFPYQERIQIIFLTCGRGSRWYWFCGHGWPYLGWCGSPMVRQILLSMGHRYVNAFVTFYWRFL